jgi:excinuclease ABC subunit B
MTEKEIGREIKRLEKQMLEHARNLEFEQAARVRDQLADVKRKVFGVEVEEEPGPKQASA